MPKELAAGEFTALVSAAFVLLGGAGACDRVPGRSGGDAGPGIVFEREDVHLLERSDSIAEVVDLEVLADGTVWVLNSVEPLLVGFDSAGQVIRAQGRLGDGPAEFGAPAGFVPGGIDEAPWIYDRQRHLLIGVSGLEAERPEITVPRDGLPPGSVVGGIGLALGSGSPVRIARLGDELVFPRRSNPGGSGVAGYWRSVWAADLVALQPRSGRARDLLRLGDVFADPTPHYDLSGAFLPFPLWYRLWAVCADSEIRAYDRLRNVIRGFTAEGVELEPTVLPEPRHRGVSRREFARATFDAAVIEAMPAVGGGPPTLSSADSTRILDGILSRVDAAPEQLASLLPRYVDFRCDETGTQWLQPFDVEHGAFAGGPVWLRITPDGEVREVRFPEGFDPYRFTAARIWGVQRNELDVGSLAWIAAPGAR